MTVLGYILGGVLFTGGGLPLSFEQIYMGVDTGPSVQELRICWGSMSQD